MYTINKFKFDSDSTREMSHLVMAGECHPHLQVKMGQLILEHSLRDVVIALQVVKSGRLHIHNNTTSVINKTTTMHLHNSSSSSRT